MMTDTKRKRLRTARAAERSEQHWQQRQESGSLTRGEMRERSHFRLLMLQVVAAFALALAGIGLHAQFPSTDSVLGTAIRYLGDAMDLVGVVWFAVMLPTGKPLRWPR